MWEIGFRLFVGAQFNLYYIVTMIRFLFYTLLVGFFLGSCTSKTTNEAHSATNDSIKKYLDLAGDERIDFKLRNEYNDKALSYVNLEKNDTLVRFYLSSISFNYMNLKNGQELRRIGKIHYEKSKDANDTLNLARYYRYKAGYLKKTFVYDSSFYYYIKAEKLYKRTDDFLGLGIIQINKGIVQTDAFDYLGAEITLFKAYYTFKKIKNNERLCGVLNQLGLIYIQLNEFDKAQKHFDEAFKRINNCNTKNKENSKAIVLGNIGFLYKKQGKYNDAIKKYENTLKEIVNIKNHPVIYSDIIDNLGDCKLMKGDYNEVPILLFESLKVRKLIKDPTRIMYSLIHLSQYYDIKGEKVLAEKYAKEALSMAKISKDKLDYLLALDLICGLDEKYIPKFFREYVDINEKFQIDERKSRNNFARIAYETDEIAQEKDKAISQKWITVGISGFIILIIALLLIITRQRTKQKELQLLQSQQKANEEIYDLMLSQKSIEEEARQNEKKRIAIELHDGVMNKLASTRLNLDVLHHKRDAQTIKECLGHIKEIYKIEQEIRNISHDLSIDIFKSNNSFKGLIEDFLNTQNKTYTTYFKLEMEDAIKWENISGSIKMNLFRIIQEASHNINKFANAKNAVITFIIDTNNLCLSVTDDGQGFDVESQTEGIGLKNIKQRVESLNGKCIIQSINKHSTSINIAIPL